MKKNLSKSLLALSLLVFLPNIASAHVLTGTSHGFQDGFLHPLSGWDHLLAMIAVGLWAAQHRGRAVWLIPASFVGVMLLGGILGVAGVYVPGAELAIAISVLALGASVPPRP
jgi:urease accessory protein